MATKDASTFLRPLAPLSASVTTVPIPGEGNALPADGLAAIACNVGMKAQPAADIFSALDAIAARQSGRVLICGSLYLAGHMLAANG